MYLNYFLMLAYTVSTFQGDAYVLEVQIWVYNDTVQPPYPWECKVKLIPGVFNEMLTLSFDDWLCAVMYSGNSTLSRLGIFWSAVII